MLGSSIILPATAPVICPCGDAGLTPEWLTAELISIFGASLTGLWIGEDILVDGSGNVTSWPHRIGAVLASVTTAKGKAVSSNGRRMMQVNQTSNMVAYANAGDTLLTTASMVFAQATTLPFPSYSQLTRFPTLPYEYGLVGSPGISNFIQDYAGKPIYRDGIATITADTNPRVYEENRPSAVLKQLMIISDASNGAWNFQGLVGTYLLTSTIPTPVQRAKAIVALKRYYNQIITADILKVASLPVDNPVIVAPLRTAIQSYGTVNSAFTLMGTPTIGADGLTCLPASSSGARITTGWSSDFTVSVRAKMLQLGGFAESGMWSTMQPTSFFAGGWGVAPGANPGYFGMTVPGVGSYSTVVANDLVFHTFTLRRSGTTTELYIDGVLRDSRNTGTTNGTVLVLGGILLNNVFSAPTNGVFKNNVQYHSALSPTNQALVEAWVAAA